MARTGFRPLADRLDILESICCFWRVVPWKLIASRSGWPTLKAIHPHLRIMVLLIQLVGSVDLLVRRFRQRRKHGDRDGPVGRLSISSASPERIEVRGS